MKNIQHIIPGAAATLAACSLISAVLLCGCSKDLQEQQAVSSLSEGDVELTIEVTGDAGTRTTITQENKILPVVWKTTDKLYVVGETDGYLGYVTNTETTEKKTAKFKGTVKGWSAAQVLHIYYLGTTDPGLAANAGEFTFSISSQGGTLDWIEDHGHIAHGATASLAPGTKTIATGLSMSNLNAVVLFDLSQWSAEGTKITGTYNSAVLNLKTGEFSTKTDGNITLAADNCTANTYVTFIPDSRALTFRKCGYETPVLKNDMVAGNFYSNGGSAIDVPRNALDILLPYPFTVAAGKQVYFSRTNLTYDGSDWQIAGCQAYYPTEWSTSNVQHFFYAQTAEVARSTSYDSYAANLFCDESHTLTVNGQTGLYVLTEGEWGHLLYYRSVSSVRYKNNVTVNNVPGCLIIAPDNFSGTIADTYDEDAWASAEKSYGLVCLPPAGYRSGTTFGAQGTGGGGNYLTSTCYNSGYSHCYVAFGNNSIAFPHDDSNSPGQSIRLVCNAK